MTKELQQKENLQWYQTLVEDCRAIIVETEFASRIALVEGYHAVGKRILEDYGKFKKSKLEICKGIAVSVGRSERTIFYALEFARKYPSLSDLGECNKEGKAISWTKIIRMLDHTKEGKEKKECEHDWLIICRKCHIKKP